MSKNKKELDELEALLAEQKELEALAKGKEVSDVIIKANTEAAKNTRLVGVAVGKKVIKVMNEVTQQYIDVVKYEAFEIVLDNTNKVVEKKLIKGDSSEAVAYSKAAHHLTESYMKGASLKHKKEKYNG